MCTPFLHLDCYILRGRNLISIALVFFIISCTILYIQYMLSNYLVTSQNILYYALYAGLQSRNEFEPGGKRLSWLSRGSEWSLPLLLWRVYHKKDGLAHVTSLSHIKYLDLKALMFLCNSILDNLLPNSDKHM